MGISHTFTYTVADTSATAMVKPSDDPAFDAAAELEGLLQAWREELGVGA